MPIPSVLVGIVTAETKDYCLKEFVQYVKSLTYPNLDCIVVDNSQNPNYWRKIDGMGLRTIHYTPKPGDTLRETLTNCSNILRDKFLKGEYDFLFSLESDIFSATNIIQHLMYFKKQVVGISYFLQSTYYSRLIPFETEDFGFLTISHTSHANLAFCLADGQCKPTYQIGLGAILIHRSILQRIKFRWDPDNEVKANADVWFHNDCRELGIPIFCDWGHFAFHYNGNWFKIMKKYKL